MPPVNEMLKQWLAGHDQGAARELASKLQVSDQTVSRWKKGDTIPRRHWPVLAEILGSSVAAFNQLTATTPPDVERSGIEAVLERLDQLDASMRSLAGRVQALEQPSGARGRRPGQRDDPTSPTPRPSRSRQ